MAYKVKKLYSCQIALVFYYSIVHLSDHVHDDFHHFFEWCVVLETKTEPVVFEVLDTIYKGIRIFSLQYVDDVRQRHLLQNQFSALPGCHIVHIRVGEIIFLIVSVIGKLFVGMENDTCCQIVIIYTDTA